MIDQENLSYIVPRSYVTYKLNILTHLQKHFTYQSLAGKQESNFRFVN
jgi:hypothetical protein